jgi:CheY-like chemotaxis protein
MILYRSLFLADDDPDDREIFMDALAEIDSSIQCLHATNGELALEALANDTHERPQIIFLDVNMPKVSGKEVLKMIRNTPEISDIPVIMYSTFFSPKDIEEITELGASHYMSKHTNFNELRNSLQNILTTTW